MEAEILCDVWLHIGQDHIYGAEQKGGSYWKRIHEYKNYTPYKTASNRNVVHCDIDGESSKENSTSSPTHMMESDVAW
jgi:hypothetical protein